MATIVCTTHHIQHNIYAKSCYLEHVLVGFKYCVVVPVQDSS